MSFRKLNKNIFISFSKKNNNYNYIHHISNNNCNNVNIKFNKYLSKTSNGVLINVKNSNNNFSASNHRSRSLTYYSSSSSLSSLLSSKSTNKTSNFLLHNNYNSNNHFSSLTRTFCFKYINYYYSNKNESNSICSNLKSNILFYFFVKYVSFDLIIHS